MVIATTGGNNLHPILSYHPTFVITGRANGAQLVEATLNDFMLPEEFIGAVCGVLRRHGRSVVTVGDMVDGLQRLSGGETQSLQQAGVIAIHVADSLQHAVPEGKPYARLWSGQERVDDIIRDGGDIGQHYATAQATAVVAPILSKRSVENDQ